MKKNPFSLYDFLGYVFPGMMSLVIIHSVYSMITAMGGNYEAITLHTVANHILSVKWEMGWENTIVFIILSYCAGHVIAYASSLTVEKVSIWLYGYPSAFIMGTPSFFNRLRMGGSYCKDFFPRKKGFIVSWKRVCEIVWKILTCLFMFPVSFCCFVLGYLLQIQELYLKPVDKNLRQLIQSKTEALMKKLGEDGSVDFLASSSDYHRLIYNYEYEKQDAHRNKMDNYVAIYGFLRALTFISNCLFVAYVVYAISAGISFSIVWHYLLALMGMTYFLFMAFMKFYRRFTMESFMCLSIDAEVK